MINTLSKTNLSKIGWEGGRSTSIWIMSLNILFFFFESTPYIRSILEQSCTVWNSGLTEENVKDIERVQKSALKLILAEKYKN